jgi:hypothetical protein
VFNEVEHRSEVRRNFARSNRGGVRVSDELIDEWTDQIMEMRDYYEKEVIRLKAMFDAEIRVLSREIAAFRVEPRSLPSNVVALRPDEGRDIS